MDSRQFLLRGFPACEMNLIWTLIGPTQSIRDINRPVGPFIFLTEEYSLIKEPNFCPIKSNQISLAKKKKKIKSNIKSNNQIKSNQIII